MNVQTNALWEQAGTYLPAPPDLSTPIAQRVAGELVGRYNEPWRAHHIFDHLMDVTAFLVENAEDLRSPRATMWAGVGHDSVYVPQAPAGVNEALSRQLTVAKLKLYLPGKELSRIGSYINATAHHKWRHGQPDLAYLLDADLKILGAPPEQFEQYDANIRAEYGFVPEEIYTRERYRILDSFYRQPRLFVTDTAHERFEDQAKANLECKLGELATARI